MPQASHLKNLALLVIGSVILHEIPAGVWIRFWILFGPIAACPLPDLY